MLFWTQLYFLASRFQLQHRNRKCIWRRGQPSVQQRNLLLPHPSVRVQPLEPTLSLLMSQGHTTSPMGTLVSPLQFWLEVTPPFSLLESRFLHLPISYPIKIPHCPALCLPSLVTLFLLLIFQSFVYLANFCQAHVMGKALLGTREMQYPATAFKELVT